MKSKIKDYKFEKRDKCVVEYLYDMKDIAIDSVREIFPTSSSLKAKLAISVNVEQANSDFDGREYSK